MLLYPLGDNSFFRWALGSLFDLGPDLWLASKIFKFYDFEVLGFSGLIFSLVDLFISFGFLLAGEIRFSLVVVNFVCLVLFFFVVGVSSEWWPEIRVSSTISFCIPYTEHESSVLLLPLQSSWVVAGAMGVYEMWVSSSLFEIFVQGLFYTGKSFHAQRCSTSTAKRARPGRSKP